MEQFPIIWILPTITFLAVIGLALWSKHRTERRMEEKDAPKSSLAKDGPGPQPIRSSS